MKSTSEIENLLLDYSKIEKTNYKARIQFYEEQKSKIQELLLKDKIEFDVDYAFALFELGKYSKSKSLLNDLIGVVIRDNIFTINEEDIYQSLLFKKSACHYNLGETEESKHILQELIKINSEEETYQTFYKRCYRNEYKQESKWMGGIVVALFLLSALIISIELMIVRPFFIDWSIGIEMTRNIVFISAILVLAAKEYLFYKSLSKKLESFTK